MKINLLAFTKYSYEGPSSRYRYYNYVGCFDKQNIKLTISPLFKRGYFTSVGKLPKLLQVLRAYYSRLLLLFKLLFGLKKYDLIIIEYELFPFFPAFFEQLLTFKGVRYIVDYDDAIFHKYDAHANPLLRKLLGGKIGQVMKMAGTVIVCNGYLEKYARRYSSEIVRLPTVVLLDRYIDAAKKHKRRHDDETFTIGWIGSKSTSVYLLDILPAI